MRFGFWTKEDTKSKEVIKPMRRPIVFAFFLCVFFSSAFAQSDQHFYDERYIRDVSDNINLGVRLSVPINLISFKTPEGKKFSYSTNEIGRLGFSFSHKWISLSVLLPQFDIRPNRGFSRSFVLNATSSGRFFNVSFNLANTKGYYLENTPSFEKWTTNRSEPYALLPDLDMFSIGGMFSYVLNHKKFSLRPIENQNAIQVKSAGSPMFDLDYSYYTISSKQGLIPPLLLDEVSPRYQLKDLNFHQLMLNINYAHIFKFWKRWFLYLKAQEMNIYAIPSYSLMDGSLGGKGKFEIRFGLTGVFGYMGEKFFWGINARMRSGTDIVISEKANFSYAVGDIYFYWGIRLGVHPKLKLISDKIGEHQPSKYIEKILKKKK